MTSRLASVPPLIIPDEQGAPSTRPAVERLPPLQGWPTSNRNGRDQIGISGRLHSGIGGRLRPEYADKQLFDITKLGPGALVPGYETDMPGYKDKLSDADIWAVLSYIESTWPSEIRAKQQRIN